MTKIEAIEKRIFTKEAALARCNMWRFQDLKIVFTNGCFDILHPGHINYLVKAADMGDVLIVAINSDESVKRLKGPDRPIISEQHRMFQVAALHFVDMVVKFDEDDPLELIKYLKPDILVKGADYDIDEIIGADFVKSYNGTVATIEYLEDFSTTKLIEKIKSLK